MTDKEEMGASLFSRSLDLMEDDPLEEIFALNIGDFVSEYLISEDLANRIFKLKEEYTNPLDFIKLLQSKNYTYSSISRALTHIILGLKQEDAFRLSWDDKYTELCKQQNIEIFKHVKFDLPMPKVIE